MIGGVCVLCGGGVCVRICVRVGCLCGVEEVFDFLFELGDLVSVFLIVVLGAEFYVC